MIPARGTVLKVFNSVMRYRRLNAVLCMMLEEITQLIDHAQSDGLQAKAQAAIPVWVEWCEWNRVHRNGGKPVSNPKSMETDLVLNAAACGSQPWEIMEWVLRLRMESGGSVSDLPSKNPTSFLDTYNDFAEFKAMETEMWLRIEEICIAIDTDQGDRLDEKCAEAIPFWETWIEWMCAHNGEPETEDPRQLQITLLLQVGVLGWEPAEIRRRLQALREENGWTGASPLDATNARAADEALYTWRN